MKSYKEKIKQINSYASLLLLYYYFFNNKKFSSSHTETQQGSHIYWQMTSHDFSVILSILIIYKGCTYISILDSEIQLEKKYIFWISLISAFSRNGRDILLNFKVFHVHGNPGTMI